MSRSADHQRQSSQACFAPSGPGLRLQSTAPEMRMVQLVSFLGQQTRLVGRWRCPAVMVGPMYRTVRQAEIMMSFVVSRHGRTQRRTTIFLFLATVVNAYSESGSRFGSNTFTIPAACETIQVDLYSCSSKQLFTYSAVEYSTCPTHGCFGDTRMTQHTLNGVEQTAVHHDVGQHPHQWATLHPDLPEYSHNEWQLR